MFKFLPDEELRKFDARKLIDEVLEITCQHCSDDGKQQYFSVNPRSDIEPETLELQQLITEIGSISGWDKTKGEKGTKFKSKVVDAYLMESMNGGRADNKHYSSYAEYFNERKKKIVQAYWRSDLIAKISRGGGDPDQMDLIVKFECGLKLDANMWSHSAPEEWYSEIHASNILFKFEKGFYNDADEAINAFASKSHDDIFGTRHFPVVVFPEDTQVNVREIVDYAKTCSKPIVANGNLIFGTRCKPYEFTGIINSTYKAGGRIAKDMEWDW